MNDTDNDNDLLMPDSDSDDGMQKRLALGHEQGPGDEFVDRIEGNTAILLKKGPNGTETREVHVSELPHGTKEGDIIPAQRQSLYSPRPGESDQDMESVVNSLYTPMPR